MPSNILLFETHRCCIIVETSPYLEFTHLIFPTSLNISLWNGRYVKSLKCHLTFFTTLNPVASPLPSLHEIRHQTNCNYNINHNNLIIMGCNPSTDSQVHLIPLEPSKISIQPKQHKEGSIQNQLPTPSSSYKIPELEGIIKKAFSDLNGRDPMGKRLYLNQVLNFILAWLPKSMAMGLSLFDAEKIVRQDLERACKEYPISKAQPIKTTVQPKQMKPYPDLFADVKNKTKQTFTDRIKELCQRSKQVSYQFNKEMQLILEKDGGFKFHAGYKFTGTKAYLRILTKVLDPFLSEQEQSKQVYTDLNHYYYTPVFKYFNTIIDKNVKSLHIQLYDWIRCKCSFKNIDDLERAFGRLKAIHGNNIFRIKNRINSGTRDLFINLKYKTEHTQIQLALAYDDQSYHFQHNLYELTREKLGIAYSCFTFMLSAADDSLSSTPGVMTSLGYLKKTLLREKLQPRFERLTAEDAETIRQEVKSLLGTKNVAALKSGFADFSQETNPFKKQPYGPDMEKMLIIKKRSNDRIYNWLNWMDQKD